MTELPSGSLNVNNPTPYYGEDSEKPIDYKYYWFLIVKNIYIVLTFIVIAGTLSFIYTSKLPPRYKATTQLILERPARGMEDEPRDMNQDVSVGFDLDYYITQKAVILGSSVLKPVAEELKLTAYFDKRSDEASVIQLRNMMKVERVEESRIFNIHVTSDDPELSANIANAVARAYIRKNFEDMLYYSREIMSWLPQAGDNTETITIKDPFGGVKQMSRDELINSLPTIRTDSTIRKLTEKKGEAESDLKLILGQYREKHPKVIKARANIKFLDDSIAREKQRIIQGLKSKAEGMMNVNYARVLEEAQAPKKPMPSQQAKIITASIIGAFVLSCIFLFLVDYFDDSIHSVEDLERKGVVLPFLGSVPLLKDRDVFKPNKGILSYHDAKSEVAESFRYLRVSINFSATPELLKVIALTSCLPHEGKSFTSDNLAVSLALDGNKTLLVDADMRRPTLHRIFKIDNTVGLSNFLTSKIDLDSIVRKTPELEDLHLVTSGPNSPNPAAILGSDRMKEFIDVARKKYDRVILDCPPLTGLGDSFVVGSLVGHVILVIAAGRTPIDLIRHTQAQLVKANVQITGITLNMVDLEKERYGGGYYRYYYSTYNRYYTSKNTG